MSTEQKMVRIIALVAIALGSPAVAAPQASSAAADSKPSVVCKYVVTAEAGSKTFRMCLTKSEWAQREAQASKDANRIECRFQEVPGTRFRSKKICQPASAWAEHRRLEREAIEQIQRSVCVYGAGC